MSIVAPASAAAATPRSRRDPVIAWLGSIARVALSLVLLAWSLVLIAWLTLHWGILPNVDRFKPRIEDAASKALGVPVGIGNIVVRSSGWIPSFELRDVRLSDAAGHPGLQLPRVFAALSPRSLLGLEVRFEQLLIEGAALDVRITREGRLIVAGLEMGTGLATGGGDHAAADWFFRQYEFVIRGGSLRWTDERRSEEPLALNDVQFVARNTLLRHDLRLDATPPAAWGDRFSINARFAQPLLARAGDWHRWTGTAHVTLPRIDMHELARHVELPFRLDEGDGAVRAWIDIAAGTARAATLDVALRSLRLRLDPGVEPFALTQIEGRLEGRRDATGFGVTLKQFGFITPDGATWPRSDASLTWRQREGQPSHGGELSAQRVDLALASQLAARLPLGHALHEQLRDWAPRGMLSGVAARWDGPIDTPTRYEMRGEVNGLTLRAQAASAPHAIGRPGLAQLNGTISASEQGGEATLQMTDGSIEVPGLWEEPHMPIERFGAHVNWRFETLPGRANAPRRLAVQVRDVRMANADFEGDAKLAWRSGDDPARRYPGVLELDARLSRASAERVARYLPLGLGEAPRRYVQQAVRSGRVTQATFRVRGDLHDFPFDAPKHSPKDGDFRVAARLEDVAFAYVPPAVDGLQPLWPVFDKLSGELVFDRGAMEIRNAQAGVFGVTLSKVQGGIRRLGDPKPVLTIDGHAAGPLNDLVRYVNESPVGTWTGNALRRTSTSGAAQLRLALTIPLNDTSATHVKGQLALDGNDVRLAPDVALFAASKARIEFTHKGFSVQGGRARVLGGETTFEGGTLANGALRFSATGHVSAEGLQRASELGAGARMAQSLSGQTSYRASVAIVQGHVEFGVTSNLVGIASALPAPFQKNAETPLMLKWQNTVAEAREGQPVRDSLQLDLGSLLHARFEREATANGMRVVSGGIGVQDAAPLPATGVAANISVATLNIDDWKRAIERGSADTGTSDNDAGYTPNAVALRAQELIGDARRLTRVVVGATRENSTWRANIDAEQLAGYVEYRPAQRASSAGRVYARLSRLSLPKSDVEQVDSLLDQQPSAVPALDVVIEDFELRGKRFGRIEIEAVNRESPRDWLLTKLTIVNPQARLNAHGNWAAQDSASTRRRTTMDFTLDLDDSGGLLERMGTPNAVKGGKGSLAGQVSWLGSPLSLDYPSLGGTFHVAIDSGQFLKTEPGAARLLGVLNLQALPRRLVLDFRDLFQEGFAFDNVTGDVTIRQGIASTNNLRMRGVQAVVLMEGNADLAKETQDLRVVIVPEINAGSAALAYAVINPAVGLGTFLAQYFLRQPLIRAGTREFQISGSWADPKIERLERKTESGSAAEKRRDDSEGK